MRRPPCVPWSALRLFLVAACIDMPSPGFGPSQLGPSIVFLSRVSMPLVHPNHIRVPIRVAWRFVDKQLPFACARDRGASPRQQQARYFPTPLSPRGYTLSDVQKMRISKHVPSSCMSRTIMCVTRQCWRLPWMRLHRGNAGRLHVRMLQVSCGLHDTGSPQVSAWAMSSPARYSLSRSIMRSVRFNVFHRTRFEQCRSNF